MAASDLHVELSDIRFAYPGQKLDMLRIDRLVIEAGARVALVGASGAGKTTLLRLLDGRLRGWRGKAKVLGRVLSPRWRPPPSERADVGFVFQDFALIDRLTMFENVRVGRLGRTGTLRSLAGRFTDADIEAVERAIADVGLEAFADQRVDRLSGGQRQRVGVARCLAQEPRIVIADEPVSNLDPAGAEAILSLLAVTTESRGATLIVSSHQPKLVRDYVGRIIGLKAGRIQMDRVADELVPEDLAALYGWQIAPHAA